MATDPRTIALNSVSGTNAYLSRVIKQDNQRAFALVSVNGTINGTLQLWNNNLPEVEYAAACGFSLGDEAATRESKEKQNTTGWYGQSLTATDVPTGATVLTSLTVGLGGGITMDANGGTAGNLIATPNAVGVTMPSGPVRRRFRFVNTSGTGTLKIDQNLVGKA